MNTKDIIAKVAITILIANFDNKIEISIKSLSGLTESQLNQNGWNLTVSPKQISVCLKKLGLSIERRYHLNERYPIINKEIRDQLIKTQNWSSVANKN